MNLFDRIKVPAFNVITRVMGYDAVWVSSVDGLIYTGRVGFKDPSEAEKLSGIDSYNEDQPYMEYIVGIFPGLKELTDATTGEIVTIYDTNANGVQFIKGTFNVAKVVTKSDGDTYVATLIPE